MKSHTYYTQIKLDYFVPDLIFSGLFASCPQAEELVQADGRRETYGSMMLRLWPLCGYYRKQHMSPAFSELLFTFYFSTSHSPHFEAQWLLISKIMKSCCLLLHLYQTSMYNKPYKYLQFRLTSQHSAQQEQETRLCHAPDRHQAQLIL